MNRILKLSLAIASTVGMVSAASAVKISPNGPVQADGSTTLVKSGVTLTCNLHGAGTVTNGVAKVTSAAFSGSNAFCASVKPTNLPWTITALTTTTGKATGVAANTPIGNCSSGTINGTFSNSTHALKFVNQTLPGGCTVSGTLTTHNNAVSIVN